MAIFGDRDLGGYIQEIDNLKRQRNRLSNCMSASGCQLDGCKQWPKKNPDNCFNKLEGLDARIINTEQSIPSSGSSPLIGGRTIFDSRGVPQDSVRDRNV